MIRRYIWICGALLCLGTAVAACGKGSAGAIQTDGVVSTEGAQLGTGSVQEAEETVEFEGEFYRKAELSESTLEWLEHYQFMPEEDRLKINYIPHEFVGGGNMDSDVRAMETDADVRPSGEAVPRADADLLLTDAPELTLSDPLSSTLNHFTLQSGNYEWSVMEDGEVLSMAACGAHPLDAVMERPERLKVPRYYRMDDVLYSVSCVVMPDRMILTCWDVSALGDVGAEAEETRTYEEVGLLHLKPGKVYEITAEWLAKRLEKRGFSGTASYVVVTE